MKNILVAVDFSQTSTNAFFYAAQLAEELDAKLILMHTISVQLPMESALVSPSYSMPQSMAEDRLKYFVNELPKERGFKMPNIEIETHVITGSPVFTISSFASENDIDLIVMGTIEKRGVFGRMIGSVTSGTINSTECPVLLIHKNTRYSKPRKIIFGLDHKGNLEEAFDKFNKLNNKLKSFTEFVHVKGLKKEPIDLVKSEVVNKLVEEDTAEYSFEVKSVDGDNPSQDIIDYCIFSKADMLVMIHHEVNFFTRLFTKSVSFNAAENIHLPVLIIPSIN